MSEILEWLLWILVIIFIVPISVIFVLPPWISGPMVWYGVFSGTSNLLGKKTSLSDDLIGVIAVLSGSIVAALVIFLVTTSYMMSWDETISVIQSDYPVKEFLRLVTD